MKSIIYLIILMHLILFGAFAQQIEKHFVYDDKGRRNPMLPLVDESGRYISASDIPYSSSVLKLSGILWDPQGKSSAIINNQIVKEGESVSGFLIKTISKNSVTIVKDNKEYLITLSLEPKE